jgi:hypothetical protein
MRNATPLRWIEEAEARQVLTVARFDQAPTPAWRERAREAVAQWLPRSRSWPILEYPTGWPVLAAQPALASPPSGRRDHRRDDDDRAFSQW